MAEVKGVWGYVIKERVFRKITCSTTKTQRKEKHLPFNIEFFVNA